MRGTLRAGSIYYVYWQEFYVVLELFFQVIEGFGLHRAHECWLDHVICFLEQLDPARDLFRAFGQYIKDFDLINLLDVLNTRK